MALDVTKDRAPEATLDLPAPDQSQDLSSLGDLPAPDLPAPDLPAPDLPAPDLPLPDLAAPDLPAPDLQAPDLLQPDAMQPDLCPATCTMDIHCDDGDPCTMDKCAGGCCQSGWSPSGTKCDDKDGCTVGDTCDGQGKCGGKPCSTLNGWLKDYKCAGQVIQRRYDTYQCKGGACAATSSYKNMVTCVGSCGSWCATGKSACAKAPNGTKDPTWGCTCDGKGACKATVTVPGMANIYGAGHKSPPAPGGSGAGVLPTRLDLPPGKGRVLRLTAVTGKIKYGTNIPANGADGIAQAKSCTFTSLGGLAGCTCKAGRYLGGVFLDASVPKDPPPSALAIPSLTFTTLAPGLRQSFFAGDGLSGTGSGTIQQFKVPDAATRLFLGFHDGQYCGSKVCCYGDNSGKLTVSLSVTD